MILFFTTTMMFSQISQQLDTVDYYIFGSMQDYGDSCKIDYKFYPKQDCDRIKEADAFSQYESIHDDNFSPKDIDFLRYKHPNGVIEHTEYSFALEIGPFDEYINYYPNGQVKSEWHFQKPDDSLSNYGIMEGLWLYFNSEGDTIGTKRFKNGLAHGKWTTLINDTTWVIKEFKDGFSEGFWSVHRIKNGSEIYRPYPFHNGFYHSTNICDENFETFLDTDEHIYQKEGTIIVEKIEYADDRRYIKNGKFYIIRDGIRIGLKEFKDGELITNIKYDYR